MELIQTKNVEEKFASYPKKVQKQMNALRTLVLETAKNEGIDTLEETLKWGEPSYLAPKGSTLRMDWKAKKPEQYALYFKCTSKLVESFIEVYGDAFTYENHRALLFSLDEKLPKAKLKKCIASALNYHNIKHLPLLGLR